MQAAAVQLSLRPSQGFVLLIPPRTYSSSNTTRRKSSQSGSGRGLLRGVLLCSIGRSPTHAHSLTVFRTSVVEVLNTLNLYFSACGLFPSAVRVPPRAAWSKTSSSCSPAAAAAAAAAAASREYVHFFTFSSRYPTLNAGIVGCSLLDKELEGDKSSRCNYEPLMDGAYRFAARRLDASSKQNVGFLKPLLCPGPQSRSSLQIITGLCTYLPQRATTLLHALDASPSAEVMMAVGSSSHCCQSVHAGDHPIERVKK